MTKNINVADNNGNILGNTYPKRAAGLVKKGRARWINAETICLCAQDMEEKTMANNIYEVFDNQITKMQEQIRDDSSETAMPVRMQILKTMEGFMAQERGNKMLNLIQTQLDFLKKDLEKTSDIDLLHAANGEAFISREETKRKMLELMGKMVNAVMTPQQISANSNQSIQNHNDSKKSSEEYSDKLNEEINSAFSKTE